MIKGRRAMMSINHLTIIQQRLNEKFIDRSEEIEAMMIALLSKQHILFIGPAGTGKSALSSMLGEVVQGSRYFQHLLTAFSTPEELFGVLSLKDLEQGVYKRNISGMLPEAHFAFIDEIFKANSAILNSLLTLINERVYYNNGVAIQSPMMTIVGSSNEYIEEGEGLEALFDRFLLRYEVDYVKEPDQFVQMLKGSQDVIIPSITLTELKAIQRSVERVKIDEPIYSTLVKIRQNLFDQGIRPSDRRFKNSLQLLRAKAYLSNRFEVQKSDLLLLKNVLWETIDQKQQTQEIISEIVLDSVEAFITRVKPEFEMILLRAENTMRMKDKELGSRTKLSELLMQGKTLFLEVQAMNRQVPNRPELMQLKSDMHKRLLQMTSDVIGF